VPAAAVIPAPIAYIKVVVVKKLVVEPGPRAGRSASPRALVRPGLSLWGCACPSLGVRGTRTFTLKKLECSKQAYARIH
jgi:hypothetical protein